MYAYNIDVINPVRKSNVQYQSKVYMQLKGPALKLYPLIATTAKELRHIDKHHK